MCLVLTCPLYNDDLHCLARRTAPPVQLLLTTKLSLTCPIAAAVLDFVRCLLAVFLVMTSSTEHRTTGVHVMRSRVYVH